MSKIVFKIAYLIIVEMLNKCIFLIFAEETGTIMIWNLYIIRIISQMQTQLFFAVIKADNKI